VGTVIILFTSNAGAGMDSHPILPVAIGTFMIFASLRPAGLFTKVQQKLSHLNTVLQENLAGIRSSSPSRARRNSRRNSKQAADDTMNQQIAVSRLFTFMFPFIFLVANLGQAAILYVGGKQIVVGTLSLGAWQEFSIYLMYLFFRIMMFGMIVTQMGQGRRLGGSDLRDPRREIGYRR